MNEQIRSFRRSNNGIIKPPAYPFSGRELFADLRRRLGEELRLKMTLDQLSRMMGTPMSTTHYWLEACPHPHVIGFMSLIERLSPAHRQLFIEAHSRVSPTLTHPRFAHHPATRNYLFRLLRKKAGLTLIGGGTRFSRNLLLTAFGHNYPVVDEKQRRAAGIDLHRPNDFVPVEGVNYIDGTKGLEHVRTCTNKIWASVATSKAPLILLNRLWSCLPELRPAITNLAGNRHVVLADEELPGPGDIRRIRLEVHLLTISQSQDGFGQIRVNCQRKK